jgi:sulfur carrier protein ThiS
MELKKLTKAQRESRDKLVNHAMNMGMSKQRAALHVNKMLRHINLATRNVAIVYNGKVVHETVALHGETKQEALNRVKKLIKVVVE